MKNYVRKYKLLILLAMVITVGGGLFLYHQTAFGHGDEEEGAAPVVSPSTNVPIEVVGDGGLGDLGTTNLSWPGEILSTTDVQIYPAREGQIAEWRIKLGDSVREGQILGRLTAPPANIELASALAERSQALVRARAQSDATAKLVRESKERLAALKEKLDYAQTTALALLDTEAQKNAASSQGALQELGAIQTERDSSITSAQAEADEAQALIPLKRQGAHAALERLAKRFVGRISIFGQTPSSADQVAFISIDRSYCAADQSACNNFVSDLQGLLSALKDPNAIPEAEGLKYIASANKLLSATVAIGGISTTDLSDLRGIIIEDQEKVLETLKEYKEAQTDLSVKQADLAKITAEVNRQVVGAQVTSNNARVTLESSAAVKQNKIAETDADFARQKSDLDTKIAELDRELSLANADVKGAEAAYGTLASGAAGQDIIAPHGGVVSALFKNTGDHVTPETAIAGISGKDMTGRFVRFHIPSDMKPLTAGDEITIARPGFSLQPAKAKVTGVGLALDINGSYAADAEFVTPIDWPVHASVRVLAPSASQSVVAIPSAAVWWNDAGEAQVWLVMENNIIRPQRVTTRQIIGDKVEITDGLHTGDRYVSRALPTLKTGQSITQSATSTSPETTPPEGDGHGHSHDE